MQLGSVRRTANETLGALTAAAAALSSVSNGSGPGGGAGAHTLWDIGGRLQERNQKAADDRTLGRRVFVCVWGGSARAASRWRGAQACLCWLCSQRRL